MGKITSNFRELYDYLASEHPSILEQYKQMARVYRVPIGKIITENEGYIQTLAMNSHDDKTDV